MLYVKYRDGRGLALVDRGFDDEDKAEEMASRLRDAGREGVEILVDLETADETAAAMAFSPAPLRVLGGAAVRRLVPTAITA
jgi:predicted O-linked N-acetylglucosamine transferase (SPINDLY family)